MVRQFLQQERAKIKQRKEVSKEGPKMILVEIGSREVKCMA
jgi:hypothetical protein